MTELKEKTDKAQKNREIRENRHELLHYDNFASFLPLANYCKFFKLTLIGKNSIFKIIPQKCYRKGRKVHGRVPKKIQVQKRKNQKGQNRGNQKILLFICHNTNKNHGRRLRLLTAG